MIIDAHAHIATWPTLRSCERQLIESQKKYGVSFSLISDCDCSEYPSVTKYGIHKVNQIEGLEATLKFVKKHKDKFGALVWVNPHNEKVTPELVDLIKKNRQYIFGLKIHPFESHIKMTSSKLIPYIKLAEELSLPILVHTAQDKYSDITFLAEVANKFPNVNFIAAHLQLCSDNKAGLFALRRTPNLYADTAWVNMKIAKKVLVDIGEDRIMFGTDNPIDGLDTLNNPMYQDYYKNKCKIPARLYHNLMYRNAIKIYKLPEIK
jgi:predicted TIM-barrel fold metal-dependent hydrolase